VALVVQQQVLTDEDALRLSFASVVPHEFCLRSVRSDQISALLRCLNIQIVCGSHAVRHCDVCGRCSMTQRPRLTTALELVDCQWGLVFAYFDV